MYVSKSRNQCESLASMPGKEYKDPKQEDAERGSPPMKWYSILIGFIVIGLQIYFSPGTSERRIREIVASIYQGILELANLLISWTTNINTQFQNWIQAIDFMPNQ